MLFLLKSKGKENPFKNHADLVRVDNATIKMKGRLFCISQVPFAATSATIEIHIFIMHDSKEIKREIILIQNANLYYKVNVFNYFFFCFSKLN